MTMTSKISKVKLPTFTTPGSDALCREIARKSHGVCFLGFSRGKDSLCAWLQLKRYFKRVIPFHCASYPCLRHVRETLDYYDSKMFDGENGGRIVRLVGEELQMALARFMYQTADDIEVADDLQVPDFSKLDIVEELRYTFNLPKAWCAFGISVSDSIDRRIYCTKTGGRNPQNLSFYPCFDWPRAEIIKAVRDSGLRLSGEYKYACRTLGGVPSATCNNIYRRHYPEDWNRIQALYPLCMAKTLRERFLDEEFEKRRAAGIVADAEPTGEDDEGDGTDVMPELMTAAEG